MRGGVLSTCTDGVQISGSMDGGGGKAREASITTLFAEIVLSADLTTEASAPNDGFGGENEFRCYATI